MKVNDQLDSSKMYFRERKRKFKINLLKEFKIKDIKSVVIPQFDELGSKVMYKKIKGYYPDIIDYFPEYKKTQSICFQRNICGIYSAPKTQALQISLYLIL